MMKIRMNLLIVVRLKMILQRFIQVKQPRWIQGKWTVATDYGSIDVTTEVIIYTKLLVVKHLVENTIMKTES